MAKKSFFNRHIFFILILTLLVLIPLRPYISLNNTLHSGEFRSMHLVPLEIMENALRDHSQLPLWNSHMMSGEPFFNIGISNFYPLTMLLISIMSAEGTLNMIVLIHVLGGAIAMYFLAYYLMKRKPMALFSALVCTFGYSLAFKGIVYWTIGVLYVPLITLVMLKALDSKEMKQSILYSILGGILFAMMFLAGAIYHLVFTAMILGLIFVYYLIRERRFKKLIVIGLVFSVVAFGIMDVKLLPSVQWMDFTNRAGDMSWEEVSLGSLNSDNIFRMFIKGPAPGYTTGAQIGIIALIFLFFSYLYYKKQKDKFILFLYAAIAFTLFLAFGGYYLFWKFIPFFGKLRVYTRLLYIYVFFASLLAGYGCYGFLLWLKERFNLKNEKIKLSFYLIVVLFLVDVYAFSLLSGGSGISPFRTVTLEDRNIFLDKHEIYNQIAEDKDLFRVHQWEIKGIDYNDVTAVVVPRKQEMLFGIYSATWYPEYFYEYLGTSFRNPPVLWGLLNTKYITAAEELNITGFELVQKFDEYPGAYPEHSDGPYLYRNLDYLPRAFIPPKAILILGDFESAKQTMYAIMSSEYFKPDKFVIVLGDVQFVDEYSLTELERYDGIFLSTGSVTQNSNYILNRVKEDGVALIPDLTQGETQIDDQMLARFFSEISTEEDYVEIEITEYTPNRRVLYVTGKTGWLFMSEQYRMYGEGWHAYADGNEIPIYRANGVLSAVYLDKSYESIEFRYFPRSLKTGLILTIITLLGIVAYLGYYFSDRFLHPRTGRQE